MEKFTVSNSASGLKLFVWYKLDVVFEIMTFPLLSFMVQLISLFSSTVAPSICMSAVPETLSKHSYPAKIILELKL